MKQIFWFGSLMSLSSIKASAPGVSEVTPAYVRWFIRDFSIWCPEWFTATFPDIKWIWFCALDIKRSVRDSNLVNGVIFQVSDEEFEEIKIREQEYDIISSSCFDFVSHENIWECFFFSANKNNGKYNHGCKAQETYLKVCLDGAKEQGDDFYEQFLKTTYLDDKPLQDHV